jgi:hypothetical protein
MSDILIGRRDKAEVVLEPRYGNLARLALPAVEPNDVVKAHLEKFKLIGRQIQRGVLPGICGRKR